MSLLLWVERRHEHDRPREHGQDESDVVFHRRFRKVLERDFTLHHEVGHYADELGVTPGALWRTLSRATGSPPRVLITERVMLEAARLLRFTELTVGEIAARIGVNDPLYLSRASNATTANHPSPTANGSPGSPRPAGSPGPADDRQIHGVGPVQMRPQLYVGTVAEVGHALQQGPGVDEFGGRVLLEHVVDDGPGLGEVR